jgi:hypothetical protein
MNIRSVAVGRAVLVLGLVMVLSAEVQAQAQAKTQAGQRPASAGPVVVELFTAQGCDGCPEANRAVAALAERPDVLALTYSVDYWDYLGWADTFARPEFAERQRAYRAAQGRRNVSTPEAVIDGTQALSGVQSELLEQAVTEAVDRRAPPPDIEFRETGDRVGVGSGRVPEGGADVFAVAYLPGLREVEVRQGDNRGLSVEHMNVVRGVAKLGEWRGRPALYDLPGDLGDGEAVAVIVQARADGRVLAAANR